jgi:lysophospholipase L1-like esterase
MNRSSGNLLAFVISFLLMAGLFEVACRTVLNTGLQYHLEMWKYAVSIKRISTNPAIGHEHTPHTQARLMNADVTINSKGLRDREVEVPKPAATKRILMLGDSIVFGWGVAQNETMSVKLEEELKRGGEVAFGGPVEVINAGVGNYNTAMEVAYFLEHGVTYAPDIVVLNYFINDAEPTPTYRDVSWLARHSYAYAVVGGAWDGFKRRIEGAPDWRAYYAGLYDDNAPGWQKTREAIAELAAYCNNRGIRLIMTNIPELRELKDYPFKAVQERLKTVAIADGVEYLDFLPAVDAEAPESLWVTAPDPHPNARAHALMARSLADYLMVHPTLPGARLPFDQ